MNFAGETLEMKIRISELILADKARFQSKELFSGDGDTLSMRIPGSEEFLVVRPGDAEVSNAAIDAPGGETEALHAFLYGCRPDTGAILVGQTAWSAALATLRRAVPPLFDEQARHIGTLRAPVASGDRAGLQATLSNGANIAIWGEQRICLGVTPDRVVLNAELFEKCAKAYVIAVSSGEKVKKLPAWVCLIAGRRMKRDQARAAKSLATGRIPEGMNAYS